MARVQYFLQLADVLFAEGFQQETNSIILHNHAYSKRSLCQNVSGFALHSFFIIMNEKHVQMQQSTQYFEQILYDVFLNSFPCFVLNMDYLLAYANHSRLVQAIIIFQNIFRMERKVNPRQKRRYSQLKAHENPISGELFPPAFRYPSFFDENLLDDDRKIKLFKNDPHAHQTIFYFQLLKTIYECEDSDYQKYLQKIYDIVENPEFEIVVPRNGHPLCTGLSSGKMKRVLLQFLEEMGEGELGMEEGLKRYPVIAKVFVLFLRSVLMIGEQCSSIDEEISPADAYELLGNYFQLEITYYDNCVRFNQVDVFVYLQSDSQVYLAYIDPSECTEEILDSSQLYQTDPGEEFNISSVKQMVSEIDIPVDTECFNTSKQNLEDTEEVEYEYSHSEMRVASRSLQDGSDLKFSYLINDDSSLQNLNVIRSNKVLEKELIGEKKSLQFRLPPPIECYEIEEAPPQLENAVSPIVTPREPKLVAFDQFDKENIYRSKKTSDLQNTLQKEYELLSTYETCFRKTTLTDFKETADSQGFFKREAVQIIGEDEPAKPTTLKSLYELKSIKSICGSDSESCFLDTPSRVSKLVSRAQTINMWDEPFKLERPNRPESRKPEPPRSKNISSDFTSSFILKQMQEPYQSSIRSMKTRARGSRTNVQKMMLF